MQKGVRAGNQTSCGNDLYWDNEIRKMACWQTYTRYTTNCGMCEIANLHKVVQKIVEQRHANGGNGGRNHNILVLFNTECALEMSEHADFANLATLSTCPFAYQGAWKNQGCHESLLWQRRMCSGCWERWENRGFCSMVIRLKSFPIRAKPFQNNRAILQILPKRNPQVFLVLQIRHDRHQETANFRLPTYLWLTFLVWKLHVEAHRKTVWKQCLCVY